MAKEQDSKREHAPIKRPADVERKTAEAVVVPSGAAPDVESVVQAALQASYGNTLVQAALDGADIEGLGSLIAGEVAAAVGRAGALSEDGAALQAVGNQAMQVAAAAAQRSALTTREALTELRGGGGRPLPTGIRAAMEQAFGASFEHVRVHTDTAEATERLGADAVAMGSHLHFREGAYSPGTREGQALIAHELTHVVQAMEGRLPNVGGVSTPGMAAEREAYGNESLSMLGSPGPEGTDVQFASSVDPSIAPSSPGDVGLGPSPSFGASFTVGFGSGVAAASMAPATSATAPTSGGSPMNAATSATVMLRKSDDVDHEETDTEASARHEVEMGLRMGFSLAGDMSEGECSVNVPKEGTGRSDGVFTGPSKSGHLAVDEYNAVMRDIGPDGESKASGADENLTDPAQHTETANDGHVHLDESPQLGVSLEPFGSSQQPEPTPEVGYASWDHAERMAFVRQLRDEQIQARGAEYTSLEAWEKYGGDLYEMAKRVGQSSTAESVQAVVSLGLVGDVDLSATGEELATVAGAAWEGTKQTATAMSRHHGIETYAEVATADEETARRLGKEWGDQNFDGGKMVVEAATGGGVEAATGLAAKTGLKVGRMAIDGVEAGVDGARAAGRRMRGDLRQPLSPRELEEVEATIARRTGVQGQLQRQYGTDGMEVSVLPDELEGVPMGRYEVNVDGIPDRIVGREGAPPEVWRHERHHGDVLEEPAHRSDREALLDATDSPQRRQAVARQEIEAAKLDLDVDERLLGEASTPEEVLEIEARMHRSIAHIEAVEAGRVELDGLRAPSARDREFIQKYEGMTPEDRRAHKQGVIDGLDSERVSSETTTKLESLGYKTRKDKKTGARVWVRPDGTSGALPAVQEVDGRLVVADVPPKKTVPPLEAGASLPRSEEYLRGSTSWRQFESGLVEAEIGKRYPDGAGVSAAERVEIQEKVAEEIRRDLAAVMAGRGDRETSMDVLRHTMKERGRERMLESLAAAPTPEDSHRLLLTMTKEMNPSDQGNLAEDWYRRVVLGLTDEGAASGAWKQHARIPARDGVSMERFADAVHNGAVHEVKSGASLTKRDKGQIRDYFMAVQMHKEVAGIPVNRVELVLTNPSALLASKNRLAELFKEGGEMLQVTVFDARGVPHGIRSKAELERMVGA